MKRISSVILIALLLLLAAGTVRSPALSDAAGAESTETPAWKAFDGKRIGVQTGAKNGPVAEACLPHAHVLYFNTQTDALAALQTGKIDAWCTDETIPRFMMIEHPELQILDGYMDEYDLAPIFPKTEKGKALRDEYSAFVDGLRDQGVLKELDEIWLGPDDAKRTVLDYESLPDTNGTLHMAADATLFPFAFVKEGRMVGYDVDIAARFCREKGYRLVVEVMDFSGILAAVQSEKVDFSATGITVTEERKESMLFGSPVYRTGTVLVTLAQDSSAAADSPGADATLDRLNGKSIGVQTGTMNGMYAQKSFPDSAIFYYNSQTDAMTALKSGKVDLWVSDEPVIRYMKIDNPEIVILNEHLAESNLGAVFPKTEKGQALRDRYSAFLEKLWADGTMAEIDAKWFSPDESRRTMADYRNLPAPNGKLRMAADLSQPPFTYMKDNRAMGYEVDIAARFCEENGYGLEVVSMGFDGILPSVHSGKCDFSSSCITISGERAESVHFSSPVYYGGIAVGMLRQNAPSAALDTGAGEAEKPGFLQQIGESLEKTFIREDRWQLFLVGILNTLLITLLSILFGTLLGFGIFMLCRNGNRAANGITRFCMWLVQGMPVVVLLMVLYYIVFGAVSISGIAVAVIGFTLIFGAAVYGIIRMGVDTVDRGQTEAAYALGHSRRRTFFRIILPQAVPRVMPAYQGEIIGLIKATAVVGYIAVQDLTKIGDIVRSRTYEAFFPLIAVTVIYFALEGLLGLAVRRLSILTDPRRRRPEEILKGVKMHDPD